MKPNQSNITCLRQMGFKPEGDELDPMGWWSLNSGWGFRMFGIRSINHLVKRLCKTHYDEGRDEGYDFYHNKISEFQNIVRKAFPNEWD